MKGQTTDSVPACIWLFASQASALSRLENGFVAIDES